MPCSNHTTTRLFPATCHSAREAARQIRSTIPIRPSSFHTTPGFGHDMSDGSQATDTLVSEQTTHSTTSLPESDSNSSSSASQKRSPYRPGATQINGTMMDSGRSTVAVAVDPVALITTECITVTSAMRKHGRWAHSSVSAILSGSSNHTSLQSSRPGTPRDQLGIDKGARIRPSTGLGDDVDDGGLASRWGLRGKKGKSMQDNPLMAGFGRLRRELQGCKGKSLNLPTL